MSRQPRQARPPTAKATKNVSEVRSSTKSAKPITLDSNGLLDALSKVTSTNDIVVNALRDRLKTIPKSSSANIPSRNFAMKAVNAVMSALSEVHQSGWTMDKPAGSYDIKNVAAATLAAKFCLNSLRSSPSQSTERVALALVARLIAVRMVVSRFTAPIHILMRLVV